MEDTAVRCATPEDLDLVVSLRDAMVAEQGEARGGFIWDQTRPDGPEVRRQMLSTIEADDAWILLGSYDSVPLGFATLRLRSLRGGETIAVIEDLFVDPEARGVGVGECLMNEILEICAANQCVGVDASVLPGNREAKNFMESHGLKARLIQVHKDLR